MNTSENGGYVTIKLSEGSGDRGHAERIVIKNGALLRVKGNNPLAMLLKKWHPMDLCDCYSL
jgi:hypothetical protein